MTPKKRKRGRPPLRQGETSVSVNVRLPVSDFDALCPRAARLNVSIAEMLRNPVLSLGTTQANIAEVREMVVELKRQLEDYMSPRSEDEKAFTDRLLAKAASIMIEYIA